MKFDDPKMTKLISGLDEYPAEVIAKFKSEVGQECTDPTVDALRAFSGYSGPFTEDECAGDCFNELTKLFLAEYFGKVSRDAAVAVCNTLMIAGGRIELIRESGFWMDEDQFVYEWNKRHPDEEKITKNVPGIV